MAVVKFSHTSGPFTTTLTCNSKTNFRNFALLDVVASMSKDRSSEEDPLSWMNCFVSSKNNDTPCGVCSRLMTELYFKNPRARYYRQALSVEQAATKLYPGDKKTHYKDAAAALYLLAKIGLATYDEDFILEMPVETADCSKPLTGQQIVGLSDAYAFLKTEYAADLSLAIQRANTIVNSGRHVEDNMPPWVSSGVPELVDNVLQTAMIDIDTHSQHWTSNGSFDSGRHYDQLKRMFAAYLDVGNQDEWRARYSHLDISEDVLKLTNFWMPFIEEYQRPEYEGRTFHRFKSHDSLASIYTGIQFEEGTLLEACRRIKDLASSGFKQLDIDGKPILKLVSGTEEYSRRAPYVPVSTEAIYLPTFDFVPPNYVTHVALYDIDSNGQRYGHKYLVDGGITSNISAFIAEEVKRLSNIYREMKQVYSTQSALAIADSYLDQSTREAVEGVDTTYLVDLICEGAKTGIMADPTGAVLTGTYTTRAEATLLALGFTKVDKVFHYYDFESAFKAKTLDRGFPFISSDPWYGIDLVDSKLSTPKKQYQDSFQSFMRAKHLFVTINPNDKDQCFAVHIPNSDSMQYSPIWEFARSIGLSREVLVIREDHFNDLITRFSAAFKALAMPANKVVDTNLTDLFRTELIMFIRSCVSRFGDRARVLVESSMSTSYKADCSLDEKHARSKAVAQTAVNIYIAVMKLVAPQVAELTQWLFDSSMAITYASQDDALLLAM